MIVERKSETYQCLQNLMSSKDRLEKINSFIEIRLIGSAKASMLATKDFCFHLVHCVEKLSIALFALLACRCGYGRSLNREMHSMYLLHSAKKHSLQAVRHAAAIILAPLAINVLSPRAALHLLFGDFFKKEKWTRERTLLQNKLDKLLNLSRLYVQKLKSSENTVAALTLHLKESIEKLRSATQFLAEKEESIERLSKKIYLLKNGSSQENSSIALRFTTIYDDLTEDCRCPIDYELLENAIFLTPCGHKFNEASLMKHLNTTDHFLCPSCRTPIKDYFPDYQTRNIAAKITTIGQQISDSREQNRRI